MSGTIFLAATETTISEVGGTILIEIRRAGSLTGDVTILYNIQGDSATAGADYAGSPGSIVMADGVESITVPITILDDALGEATEILSFALVSATGAGLVAPRTHRISILDDETPAPPPPVEPPLASPYEVVRDELVGGLNQPVRFAFHPTDPGLAFVAEKGGIVRLADLTNGTTSVLLDLTDQVNSAGDRGLLDAVLHPDLAANPYLYLFYVVDPPETAGQGGNEGPDGGGNRYSHIVRYTLDAATGHTSVVDGSAVVLLGGAGSSVDDISGGGALDFTDPAFATEVASDRMTGAGDVVIDGIKQDFLKADSLSHNGGKMLFGPDGMLYILTGDATSYNYADPHTADVQSLHTLSGKVLRIDPITGQGLADNPFAAGAANLDANMAKVFQLGLRNPFSAAFDGDGRLFIADVGWFSFEEVNSGGPGANFGWPWYEGGDGQLLTTPGYRDQPGAQPFYDAVAAGTIIVTDPFRGFAHDGGAPGFALQSVTSGGIIVTGTVYPEELLGHFVFSDFVGGNVFHIDTADSTDVGYLFDFGDAGPVHMAQGADGYLYYADILTGTIGRLEITLAPPPVPQSLEAIGNANVIDAATGEVQLTPNANNQVGGLASTTRIDIRQDARFRFELLLDGPDSSADGAAFALHNDARGTQALGTFGGGLGAAGIANGIAVEYDVWPNAEDSVAADHTAIILTEDFNTALNPEGFVDLGNIEGPTWHQVEVQWDAETQTLATYFGGVLRTTLVIDLASTVFGGNFAHFLFSAATGGVGLDQRVRNIVADVTYEDVAEAQAPVLFGGATQLLLLPENSIGVAYLPTATDAEGGALTWSLAGADLAAFSFNAATGEIAFLASPDFEQPTDANGDNDYQLVLTVADAGGLSASQALTIRIADIAAEEIIGTSGNDLLLGRPGDDVLRPLAGADTVRAGDGADTIQAQAGDGDDSLHGGAGANDLYDLGGIEAGVVVNLLTGRADSAATGSDRLRSIEDVNGGTAADLLIGSAGSNRLAGGDGADTLLGGAGDDWLLGGAGEDSLSGGLDADRMQGGAGNDSYEVDEPDDVIVETADGGIDSVSARADFVLDAHVENLRLIGTARIGTGNAEANRITGNALDNHLGGGAGNDTLTAGAGADTLTGGDGLDQLIGGTGADAFLFTALGAGEDRISDFGAGDRLLISAAGFGGGLTAGMNLLAGGRFVENLTGAATSAAGIGQFTYETDRMILRFDADGTGGAASVIIARFTAPIGFDGTDLQIIA